MKSIKVDNSTITLYASIRELPVAISKKFSSYLLQDLGIGNSVEDMDNHLSKIMSFIQNDKKEDAMEEAKNLRYNLFSMLSEWDYKSLSFACLIFSVNGERRSDYTLEGLNNLLDELSEIGLTNDHVYPVLEEVKKNLIPKGVYTSLNTLGMI